LFQGVGDGFALRVKHGLFGCDDYFCFHANRTEGCWVKKLSRASFIWRGGLVFWGSHNRNRSLPVTLGLGLGFGLGLGLRLGL
jgi:hypothetical protein